MTGSKIVMSSTILVFFWLIGKTRWQPRPLKPLNRIQQKLDRKQDLKVLFKVFVYRTNRKNKMVALASDWLRHYRLLFWDCWREFNKNWQEARSQCPLPCLCFSGQSEKQDGRHSLWLAETISTSPLKPLNRIQQKLDEKQDLNVLYEVCVFRPNRKNKLAATASDWLRHFHFSETAEWNSNICWQKERS